MSSISSQTLGEQPASSELNKECRTKPWFAVLTRAKAERWVSTALRGKGLEEFLPLYRSRHVWSDRTKELDLPLFPGYIFCRLEARADHNLVLKTPGVLSIVGSGRTPTPVEDREMESIRALLNSGCAATPHPFLKSGDRVYLDGGPLAGVEGFVVNADKKFRLVVSITLLQRSVSVEIDRKLVRPVTN